MQRTSECGILYQNRHIYNTSPTSTTHLHPTSTTQLLHLWNPRRVGKKSERARALGSSAVSVRLTEMIGDLQPRYSTIWLPKQDLNKHNTNRHVTGEGNFKAPLLWPKNYRQARAAERGRINHKDKPLSR